jgi:toxin FitB
MTILDTNVISELMKIVPSPAVLAWTGTHAPEDLFISTISMAEILFGIEWLPKSKRRDGLLQEAETTFAKDFADRILPFDEQAARAFGPLFATRRRQGRPMGVADAQIASIAIARGAVLATRNTGDFEDCGLNLVNPWQSKP